MTNKEPSAETNAIRQIIKERKALQKSNNKLIKALEKIQDQSDSCTMIGNKRIRDIRRIVKKALAEEKG